MSILNPEGTMFPHKIVYPSICPGSEVEGGKVAGEEGAEDCFHRLGF